MSDGQSLLSRMSAYPGVNHLRDAAIGPRAIDFYHQSTARAEADQHC